MRILIVEDEPEIASLLSEELEQAGFHCDLADGVNVAALALRTNDYELMLLDRRLPDGDGLFHLSFFRSLKPTLRIIMLTARDAPNEKALGLDAGADDYIAKPYDRDELLARVRARLRQTPDFAMPPIRLGALTYDPTSERVLVRGELFVTHRRETALLDALLRRANQVTRRQSIMEEVYPNDEAVLPGALDTLVSRLRRRLAEADSGVTIHLVRGRGYLITETTL